MSRKVWGGGQDLDAQCDIFRKSWLGFHSQLNLHTAEQGLQKLYDYFVTGEDI
jgi:hypothetical protein